MGFARPRGARSWRRHAPRDARRSLAPALGRAVGIAARGAGRGLPTRASGLAIGIAARAAGGTAVVLRAVHRLRALQAAAALVMAEGGVAAVSLRSLVAARGEGRGGNEDDEGAAD